METYKTFKIKNLKHFIDESKLVNVENKFKIIFETIFSQAE